MCQNIMQTYRTPPFYLPENVIPYMSLIKEMSIMNHVFVIAIVTAIAADVGFAIICQRSDTFAMTPWNVTRVLAN
jgi:hypothetical protein